MSYCAPSIDIKDHYTCFEFHELKTIAKSFNDYIAKNKSCPVKRGSRKNGISCNPKRPIKIENKTKRELWFSIYNRLKYLCPYEYCWVDLDFINGLDDKDLQEKLQWFTFKPKMTRTQNAWLSTQDINNVLQQYQDIDPSFKFLGALPSDFYKVTRVDYSKIFDHKRIAIVFNLDEHDQPGSHWVAFLIDNKSKTLEYYDSAGKRPNRNIQSFIDTVYEYLKSHGFDYKLSQNTNADALIGMTQTGYTAFMLSCFRPKSNLYIFTKEKTLVNQLSLSWGIRAFFYDEEVSLDEIISDQIKILKERGFIREGEVVVNTGSTPIELHLPTNTIKVTVVK